MVACGLAGHKERLFFRPLERNEAGTKRSDPNPGPPENPGSVPSSGKRRKGKKTSRWQKELVIGAVAEVARQLGAGYLGGHVTIRVLWTSSSI